MNQTASNEATIPQNQYANYYQDDSKLISTQQSVRSTEDNIPLFAQSSAVDKQPQQQPITVNLFGQKLDKATNLKNEGNTFFKNKDYTQAIKSYTQGLQQLSPNYFYGATQQQCVKMAEISSILLFNLGSCYFNSYDWQRADIFYSEAIIINPKYIKALHKRALARYELKRYDEAFADVKAAFSQDTSNQEIYKSYQKILEKYNEWVREAKKNEKSFSANIFNKETKKTESPLKTSKIQKTKEMEDNGISWSWLASGVATVGLVGFTLYRMLQK